MTKNIIIVPGSVRKGSVASKIVEAVSKELAKHSSVTSTVVDLKAIDLPFFDNEHMPAHPSFTEANEHVANWTSLVHAADGVMFITPEYNRSLSAVQKNAIDWIYKEWENKPTTSINYGFSGGARSLEDLVEVLGNVKANFLPSHGQLFFMKDLNPDGSAADEEAVTKTVAAVTQGLVNAL